VIVTVMFWDDISKMVLSVTVRAAERRDAAALASLREEAGWHKELIPEWFRLVDRGQRLMWVAELDNWSGGTSASCAASSPGGKGSPQPKAMTRIVAMVAMDLDDEEDESVACRRTRTASLASLAVGSAARGLGLNLGLVLLKFGEQVAQRLGVRTITSTTMVQNVRSIAISRRLHFVPIKTSEKSYGSTVLMSKSLQQPPFDDALEYPRQSVLAEERTKRHIVDIVELIAHL